ncbi:hypothetical protein [Hansschlegelia zhihuaiae]|uniref:Glycosyltransferase RgtA/B/C/D-like domain-containing protein n=1 Tax=Hansschlegelia zhihuaiae TaxID=405005 RepID=A0A4Q0MMY5_9HYPH|nr:hypothetical protein [Hansschlegelia zhihuaiae]RXF74429.1 hypothetical protein EK403_06335 [Hansschlegelia zhihuaiae]
MSTVAQSQFRPVALEGRVVMTALACLGVAASYLLYWTLFPELQAGAIGNDALFLADGARRIAAGATPHADFSLPTGAEPFLGYYLAERFLPQISPFIGSQLFGFALLVPLLIAAASQLPSRLAAVALIALASAAALLPFNLLPTAFYGISFHASYNRLGTAFAIIYLAWVFRAGTRPAWVDGLLIGYALLFAFFLKIVFFGLVFAPLIVLVGLDARFRRMALIGVAAFVLVLVAVEAATGMVGAYLADIRAMSRVNGGRAPYLAASFVFRNLVELALVAAAIALLVWDRLLAFRQSGGPFFDRARPVAIPVALAAALGALVFAESQATGGLEATGALGLLFAPGLFRPARTAPLSAPVATAAVTLAGGVYVATVVATAGGVLLKRQGPTAAEPWTARFMPHLVVPEDLRRESEALEKLWTNGREAVSALGPNQDSILQGFRLTQYLAVWRTVDAAIARLGGERDLGGVMTLTNVDLFGLALGAKPVEGAKVVHDVGRTITPLTPQQASDYLADADTVFEPTCRLAEAPVTSIAPWFTSTLAAEFTVRELTPCWTMHRRKVG